jgi:hypothetical protein
MLEMAFTSAYVIYYQQFQRIPLLEFRRQVSQWLMTQKEFPVKNRSPKVGNSEVKFRNSTK